MSQAAKKPAIKRFYKQAAAMDMEDGWGVALDGRFVRTPGQNPLLLPTRPLAEAIAAEWNAQGEKIHPESMPMMQYACSAIDYVQPFRRDVLAELRNYSETDLLCYRTEDMPALARRQAEQWNPVLEWAEKRFAIHPELAGGIMPVAQDAAMLDILAAEVGRKDDFRLCALWLSTKHTASVLLALALLEGCIQTEHAFALSRLEETFQNEQWGEDDEARQKRESAAKDMVEIGRFLQCLSG